MQDRGSRTPGAQAHRSPLVALVLLLVMALAVACGGTPNTAPPAPAPTAAVALEPTATPANSTATPPRSIPTTPARPTLAPTRTVATAKPSAPGSENPVVLNPPAFVRVGLEGESIRTLAIGGKDSRTIYAGGAGLSRSTDGGTTWQTVRSGTDAPFVVAVAIAASDPQIVYVGVSEGCGKGEPHTGFVSIDGGETWKKTLNGIASIVIDPKDATKVSLVNCTGVMRTTDGGAQWQQLSGAAILGYSPTLIAAAPSNANLLYVVAAAENGATKVMRTIDDGKTWREVSPATVVNGPRAFTIDTFNPDTIFLSTTIGLYHSRNGGQSWTTLAGVGLELTAPARPPVGSPDGFRITTVFTTHPEQLGVYWLGTGTGKAKGIGLLRTRDGGETWRRVNGGLEGRPIQALALGGPLKDRVLYAATDDGIWLLTSP